MKKVYESPAIKAIEIGTKASCLTVVSGGNGLNDTGFGGNTTGNVTEADAIEDFGFDDDNDIWGSWKKTW